MFTVGFSDKLEVLKMSQKSEYQIYIETFFYALIFILLQRWPVFLLSFGGKSLHISVLQLENERGRVLVKDRAFYYAEQGAHFLYTP